MLIQIYIIIIIISFIIYLFMHLVYLFINYYNYNYIYLILLIYMYLNELLLLLLFIYVFIFIYLYYYSYFYYYYYYYFINPRRTCAARVTVVGLCVCVSTLNLPPHTIKSQNKDTNGFIAIQEPFLIFADFPKMLVQKLWRNLLTSSSSGIVELFFP